MNYFRIFLLLSLIPLFIQANAQIPPPWTQTKGPGAGVTTAMITVDNIILAANRDYGKTDGNVYRSTNFGDEWIRADNTIGAYTVNQFANINNYIFAATPGGGIFRTTDYGNTWVNLPASPFQVLTVFAKDNILFAGLNGAGVYVSYDLGETWIPRNNGLPIVSIVYELSRVGNYVFAGLEGSGGPARLYRTSNDGVLWELSNNGLPLGSNVHQFTVKKTKIITSIEGDFANYVYSIYRSTNNGNSWAAANNGIPFVVGGTTGEIFAHMGELYAAISFSGFSDRIYKSTNNGDSWIPRSSGIGNQEAFSFTAAGPFIFAGLGSYRSVFRTFNGGVSWHVSNKGLANSAVFKLIDHNGRIYAGAQEGLFYTNDLGENWTEMLNGLPFGLPITAMEKNGDNIYLGTEQYGIFRSTDNGSSWSEINSGITGTFAKYIDVIFFKDNILYAGTWDGVFKSTNNGNSWILASTGLPVTFGSLVEVKTLTALGNALYAGTVLERIYKSTNQGASWFPSGSGLPFTASTVHYLLAKDNDLFAATNDGIYKSTNEGASWLLIGLEGPIRTLAAKNNLIFASAHGPTVLTGYGVFVSTDNGVTWATFDTGIRPNARVRSLLIYGNELYGATDTRSVWKRFIAGLLTHKTLNITMLIQGFYNPMTNSMIQDTVTVYLRNTSAPYSIVDSAKVFLSSSGTGTLSFFNVSNGIPYYIQVKHRNSLETWSKIGGEVFTADTLNYDFTFNASQSYESNQTQVDDSPLRFAIYSGDVNQDGIVDASDLSIIENDAFIQLTGYVASDINGDQIVDASDISILENNTANTIIVRNPILGDFIRRTAVKH